MNEGLFSENGEEAFVFSAIAASFFVIDREDLYARVMHKNPQTTTVRLLIVACGIFAALAACKSDTDDSAPTCADLRAQYDACPGGHTKENSDAFDAVCPQVSEDCRSCLDGKLCGVTEQCDSLCKVSSSSTADGG